MYLDNNARIIEKRNSYNNNLMLLGCKTSL